MAPRLIYLGPAAGTLRVTVGAFLKTAEAVGVGPVFWLDGVAVYDERDVTRVGDA